MADSKSPFSPPTNFQEKIAGYRRIDISGSFGECQANARIYAHIVASTNQSGPSVIYDEQEFSSRKMSLERTMEFSPGLSKPFKITLKIQVDAISVVQTQLGPFFLKSRNDGSLEVVPPEVTSALNRTIYRLPWNFQFSGGCKLSGPWGEKDYPFSIPRSFLGSSEIPMWRLSVAKLPEKLSLCGLQQMHWHSAFVPRMIDDVVGGIPIAVYTGGEVWQFGYGEKPIGVLTDTFKNPAHRSGTPNLSDQLLPLRGKAKTVADYITTHPGKLGNLIAEECGVNFEYFRKMFGQKLRPRGFTNAQDGEGYFPPAQKDDVPRL
jgi:hypothetical protein